MQLTSKISVWIFTALYFLMSTGIGYSAHYCGEELFKFGHIASDISCCCDDDGLDDCCHNETYFVQLEDVQQVTTNDIRLDSNHEIELLFTGHVDDEYLESIGDSSADFDDFPDQQREYLPLYLTYTSFIFYG